MCLVHYLSLLFSDLQVCPQFLKFSSRNPLNLKCLYSTDPVSCLHWHLHVLKNEIVKIWIVIEKFINEFHLNLFFRLSGFLIQVYKPLEENIILSDFNAVKFINLLNSLFLTS